MIIANTFPKSGTGLLRQVLKPFGKDNLHFGMFHRVTGEQHSQSTVMNTLQNLVQQDGFVTAHLHWHPTFEHILFPNHKMIMLIRDPREVVVSHVKYVRAMPEHNLHKYFMSMDEEHCYFLSMAGIDGELPNLADRFLPYLGWCRGRFDYNVQTINYLELSQSPEATCRKIASHIYPTPPPDADDFNVLIGKMLMGIDPEKSNTYRPGDHREWQEEMPPDAQDYFIKHFDWLLRLMNSKMYY